MKQVEQAVEGSVSLVRKTVLGRIPIPKLNQAFKEFDRSRSDLPVSFPEMEWEVKGPVMQILPIAIYT